MLILLFCCWATHVAPLTPFGVAPSQHAVGSSLIRYYRHRRLCSLASANVLDGSAESVDNDDVPLVDPLLILETAEATTTKTLTANAVIPPHTAASSALMSDQQFDFPWTDLKQWTLRDQVSRYTLQVPGGGDDNDDDRAVARVITLWRTLVNESLELSGYPLEFLVERFQVEQLQQQQQQQANSSTQYTDASETTKAMIGADRISMSHTIAGGASTRIAAAVTTTASLTILPYLDDFYFTASGGLSGSVYGVRGVAGGTRIETTPVQHVQTVRQGFVRTTENVIYELGKPRRNREEKGENQLNDSRPPLLGIAHFSEIGLMTKNEDGGNPDVELVQLAALTAVVSVGAAAFASLSHHLTVNVFWV
jgi:hypothetical protein